MSTTEQPLEDWQVTGLIYKVANEIMGRKKPDSEAQSIISQIAKLKEEGKLNTQQLQILFEMNMHFIDSDLD